MSFCRLKRRFEQIWRSIAQKTCLKANSSLKFSNQSSKDLKLQRWKPQLFAYRLFGERINFFLPLFKDLDNGLCRSGLRISFKPYVSLTLLTSFVAAFATMLLVPLLLQFSFHIAAFPALLFGIGGGLMAGAFAVIAFYVYPLIRAESTKRDLDDSMAFAAGYLAILAGSGVPPDSMFRSLSNIPQKIAIVKESRTIIRDIELFGVDIITSLENASKRTSSEKFKELLEGFIATIHSGSNLTSYLLHRSRQNMKSKRISLKKFSDTLAVLSEFYVTLLVAGPLIFVVMFAVMAMLGGVGFGILDPALLLMLLSYIAIPAGSVIFIVVLDALTPRW